MRDVLRSPMLRCWAALIFALLGCDSRELPGEHEVLYYDAAMLNPPTPDAGVGHCRGVAESCVGLSTVRCEGAGGCAREANCVGRAIACVGFSSPWECNRQVGCSWLSRSRRCSGVSRSCTSYSELGACVTQEGCDWERFCGGIPTLCAQHTGSTRCLRQPGCEWVR